MAEWEKYEARTRSTGKLVGEVSVWRGGTVLVAGDLIDAAGLAGAERASVYIDRQARKVGINGSCDRGGYVLRRIGCGGAVKINLRTPLKALGWDGWWGRVAARTTKEYGGMIVWRLPDDAIVPPK